MLIPLTIECIGNPRLGFQPAWIKEVRGVSRQAGEQRRNPGQAHRPGLSIIGG